MGNLIVQKNASDVLNLILFIFAFTSIPFLISDKSLPNLSIYMISSLIISFSWFVYSLMTFKIHIDFNMNLSIIHLGIFIIVGIIASFVVMDIVNTISNHITYQLIGLSGTLICCLWLSYFIITNIQWKKRRKSDKITQNTINNKVKNSKSFI